MKLNETLEVISYNADVTSLDFVLNATKADVLAATEGRDLELKAGTATVGLWKGWTVTGVVDYVSRVSNGSEVTYTRMTAARALASDTKAAIAQLESNMQRVSSDVATAMSDAASAVSGIADIQTQFNVLAGVESTKPAE